MNNIEIGVIGGSGLYQMDALENKQEHTVETPYGRPSELLLTGTLAGVPVVFLARHGKGHRLIPSEVPYRANIYALKKMGVRYLLSFSAVGSLSENMAPLDLVLPDQFIDMTKQRSSTFFGDGAVAHVSMAQPVCEKLSDIFARAVEQRIAIETEAAENKNAPIKLHKRGTYVCIEGPQFSSMAESHWYRAMGAHIIGMTNMPEAKLAREAQIAYATLAMVTDYDCWHPKEAHVNANMALANLMKNAERAQHIAACAIQLLAKENPSSTAHTALSTSLVTSWENMLATTQQRLKEIVRGN
jgi:5'-methylthioadenosine phosphorylase